MRGTVGRAAVLVLAAGAVALGDEPRPVAPYPRLVVTAAQMARLHEALALTTRAENLAEAGKPAEAAAAMRDVIATLESVIGTSGLVQHQVAGFANSGSGLQP